MIFLFFVGTTKVLVATIITLLTLILREESHGYFKNAKSANENETEEINFRQIRRNLLVFYLLLNKYAQKNHFEYSV